jgi:cell division protein ZapA (FtsZ GTPase activity inhibitor)
MIGFCTVPMGNEEHDRERAFRERIAGLAQANDQAGRKPVSQEELQQLKAAAGRLDQLLSNAADAEAEELKAAASRLDQMLSDIAGGSDALKKLKRRAGKDTAE